ncbi:FecR family protein [Sphingopyxis sp. YR583]|uniref:FecR family protein n=1 Tax=Sphingopyxis sp. YR583 TaxID=1881047 RepID=UPI0008A80440|nr:FecR domain-containing protein [Sphingopyxis sp. YR583]SEH13001.1 FecR family protein [Sphingopyxis sp. YR583]
MSEEGKGSSGGAPRDMSAIADKAGEWCMIFAERALTPLEAMAFEDWIEADPEHRQAFERASFIWRALDGKNSSPALLSMRMEALAALAGQDDARNASIPPRWWQRPLVRRSGIGALAASIVAAISFMALQPASVPAGVQYATALGERRVVMLDDGSRLSMDAASEVDVAYSQDKRELVLKSGRAKFDVSKDPLKPFTVIAGDKIIVATGTSFSVEILNGEVNVVLFEGHVAVLNRATRKPAVVPSHGRLDAADQLLKPGQELSLPAVGAAKLETVDVGMARSWEAGQLSFADEPLAQAVERMNRYSSTKFAIGDAAAGRVAISGVFNSDEVNGFVSGVTDVFPVRTIRRGDEVLFVTK